MLIKYDGTELDAAIINAFFAAYIESPFDHELVEGALSADDSKLSAYQTERANYHKDRRTALGDVGMSLLFSRREDWLRFCKSPKRQLRRLLQRHAAACRGRHWTGSAANQPKLV